MNDWAGLGQAYPDWMHDYNAQLIRSTHANYIRWMHMSPQAVDVRACDRTGIVEVCPAGDKEKDVQGRQWEQRMEVMRDSMIYFRNSPSILFWEAGNNSISAEHLQQMVDLRKECDPHGGRVMGCRTLNEAAATPIAEYFGVMVGQDRRTDALKDRTAMFRAYQRRAPRPCADHRDGGFPRRGRAAFLGRFFAAAFRFQKGAERYLCMELRNVLPRRGGALSRVLLNKISNTDPAHAKWSGYASIYWSDSNADGRQDSSEVCRVSGKVDSVRLPKQAYYVYRVMQSDTPDIHIIGHWNYPANTTKTVYVAANHCDDVELFVNGKSAGKIALTDGYIFAFPGILLPESSPRRESSSRPARSRRWQRPTE